MNETIIEWIIKLIGAGIGLGVFGAIMYFLNEAINKRIKGKEDT